MEGFPWKLLLEAPPPMRAVRCGDPLRAHRRARVGEAHSLCGGVSKEELSKD